MRKTLKILAVAAALSLSVGGCRRDPPPSPEYEQAFQTYLALRTQHQDAAFLAPEMDAVLQQLSTVDPESSDAAAARQLERTIREGRDAALAHQDALAAARQAGRTPIQVPESPGDQAPPDAPAPAAGNPVAQTPQPVYGMTVAQLREQFSRCFQPGAAMHIPGKGLRDIWELKDLQVCRELHPKYVRDVVLLEDGKVWGSATPGARIEFPAPDAGTPAGEAATPAPAADAGTAAPAP